jgi:DNA invertase Pin-like site-specific DNA recombinase
MKGNFISYLRVSTERQGRSGLGLEAQRKAVEDWLNGGNWTLLDEFIEVESGKRSDRPELTKALRACKAKKATLVIARLDRLSRDVHFISGLMKSGIDFIACDFPQANKLTIHILAAVAEHEREMISARTKAALQAAKERGKQLGSRNLVEISARGTASNRARARAWAANVLPVIEQLRATGATTLEAIAKGLNGRGVPAPRGGEWHKTTVQRVLRFAPAAEAGFVEDVRNRP